jgi:hypothetical protein
VNGNSDTKTAVVTVIDDIDPTAVCKNITVQLDAGTNNGDGSVTITPAQIDNGSSDACGVALMTLSQSTFVCGEVGVNPVILTVTDVNGNTATCNATVTVQDKIRPLVYAPVDYEYINTNNDCEVSITPALIGAATAVDNCGILTITGARQGGLELNDPYPIGITIITWSATDVNGNISLSVDQKVTVTGSFAVTFTGDAEVPVPADPGICTAIIPYTSLEPVAVGCGSYIVYGSRNDYLDITAPYPLGNTYIIWIAFNDFGEVVGHFEQTVTVFDDQEPVIAGCPSDITQNNDLGNCSAVVTWTEPAAADNCTSAANLVWVKSHLPGATFPVGTTQVTYTAKDEAGNISDVCSFSVTVTDNEKPVITAKDDITQTADAGLCSAIVTIVDATATDNCEVGAVTGTRSDALALTAA